MAALLSPPLMQVTAIHGDVGDAAQLAAHVGRKVRGELWQRNLFRRTKRGAQKNNKRRTCEKMLQKMLQTNASKKCFKKRGSHDFLNTF